MNWDEYFIQVADLVRVKSKDPSTKVGAILTLNNSIFSTGFNGFPIGIDETDLSRWERPIKYDYVCHAERNAIALAARKGSATLGSTLYLVGMGSPTMPCIECAKMIIQSGIIRVVGHAIKPIPQEWQKNFEFAEKLLVEAGVELEEL